MLNFTRISNAFHKKVQISIFNAQITVLTVFCTLFLPQSAFSQQVSELTFETSFCEGLERWVIFPNQDNKDVSLLGFVYFDTNSGLTFRLESYVRYDKGNFQLVNSGDDEKINLFKLNRNSSDLYLLSNEQRILLNLPLLPVWYIPKEPHFQYQLVFSSTLNGAGCSSIALPILENLFKKDGKNEELLFEFAYAHNALKQYDMSLKILKKALKEFPKNGLLYKESIYANVMLLKLDAAEKNFALFVNKSDDLRYQTESAYNIAYGYFLKRNQKKFDEWFEITRVSSNENSPFIKNLQLMKSEW